MQLCTPDREFIRQLFYCVEGKIGPVKQRPPLVLASVSPPPNSLILARIIRLLSRASSSYFQLDSSRIETSRTAFSENWFVRSIWPSHPAGSRRRFVRPSD